VLLLIAKAKKYQSIVFLFFRIYTELRSLDADLFIAQKFSFDLLLLLFWPNSRICVRSQNSWQLCDRIQEIKSNWSLVGCKFWFRHLQHMVNEKRWAISL